MKAVAIICATIVVAMLGLSVRSYYQFTNAESDATQRLDISPLINSTDDAFELINDSELPEWCNDKEYVDTVAIPMQEQKYNIHWDDTGIEPLPKRIICVDSEACHIHDSMYQKSIDARDLKIQLIKINTKLDSIEQKY